MCIPCRSRLVLIALLAISSTVARGEFPRPEELVQASLVADVTAIEPGKPFRLAVVLTIKPRWHIYWTNPGDAGEPTRVEWTVPEGYSISSTAYPIPKRFEQEGPIVNYGYENEVWLIATVTPPERVVPGTKAEFVASVEWQACEKVCIPGIQKVRCRIPVGRPLASDAAPLFEEWSARLPLPAGELPEEIQSIRVTESPRPEGGRLAVEVRWRQDRPESEAFFPARLGDAVWTDVRSESNGGASRFTAGVRPLAGQKLPTGQYEALVSFEDKTGRRRGVAVAFRVSD